jgi:hypothetical protein
MSATCADRRCTDGVTMCQGCNGYGVLRKSGARFTLRGGGKYISAASPRHGGCAGTGLAACGCRVLDSDTVAALAS